MFRCDSCGKTHSPRRGGDSLFVRLPSGWFFQKEENRYACSEACAAAESAKIREHRQQTCDHRQGFHLREGASPMSDMPYSCVYCHLPGHLAGSDFRPGPRPQAVA